MLHGDRDPLLPVVHGECTAALDPGARLARIESMGHTLQPGVILALMPPLLDFLNAVKTSGAPAS